MASSSSSPSPPIRFLAVAIVIFLVISPAAAITCSDVLKGLRPCLDYLKNGSGKPPQPCCDGAKSLAAAATTTADKQTVCGCLKNAWKNINAKPENAKSLPGNCGISLPIAVSPNVDCSKIN